MVIFFKKFDNIDYGLQDWREKKITILKLLSY